MSRYTRRPRNAHLNMGEQHEVSNALVFTYNGSISSIQVRLMIDVNYGRQEILTKTNRSKLMDPAMLVITITELSQRL